MSKRPQRPITPQGSSSPSHRVDFKRPRSMDSAASDRPKLGEILTESSTDGEFEGFSRRELILLMMQTCESLDLKESKKKLEQESGINIESDEIKKFRFAIFEGRFQSAVKLIPELGLKKKLMDAIRFLCEEQNFMELLHEGEMEKALEKLQGSLSASAYDGTTRIRLHEDASFLMCSNNSDLEKFSGWKFEKSRNVLWERIRKLLPANVMVPNNRLTTLLKQAADHQKLNSLYYAPEPTQSVFPLMEDFLCKRSSLPGKCIFFSFQKC